jgi:hypothetical protein
MLILALQLSPVALAPALADRYQKIDLETDTNCERGTANPA